MTTTEPTTVAAWLAEASAGHRDAPALGGVDDAEFLTHGGLLEQIAETGRQLRGWGIGRGDIVLVAISDGPVALAVLLSVASVATPLPVPAHEQPEEYARLLDALPIRAVVIEERPDANLTMLARQRGISVMRAVPRRAAGAGSFDMRGSVTREPRNDDPPSATDDALLCLTSGTSSLPKVVALTHESLWAGVRGFRDWTGMTAADVSLCMMPIAHLHSLIRSSLPVLAAGGAVVWAPGFSRRAVLGWLDRFTPTFISAAPTIHRRLLTACEEDGWRPSHRGLRLLAVGSDRIEPATIRHLADRFQTRVVQFYGLSETSPFIAATPVDGPRGPEGSAGRLNPAWKVDLIDADGAEVPPGETGEIAVADGFINRLVGTGGGHVQRIDAEGRLRTGDLGRIDADGFLFIEGRTDDCINRGGEKVHPAAVEAALGSHPRVTAAVAFGIPDPILGARVGAVVECDAVPSPTVDELLEHAARELKSFMVPERLFIVPRIPTNRLGKVSRRDLAARFGSEGDTQPRRGVPGEGVCESVADIFRKVLQQDAVAADAGFFELGGDSISALDILLALEERFGVSISPATFMRKSSPAALAAHIADDVRSAAPVELARVQAGRTRLPVICLHGVDGGAFFAAALARGIGPDVPLAAFHARASGLLAAGPRSLADLTRGYAALLLEQLPGPYLFLGHSLGAHVAAATAGNVLALGATVGCVGVLDDEADLQKRLFGAVGRPAAASIRGFYERSLAMTPAAPFAGRIVLFRAEENDAAYRSDPTAGWGEVALGGVSIVPVEGNHYSLVQAAGLERIGPAIVAALDAAVARPGVNVAELDRPRQLRYEARLAGRQGDLPAEVAAYRAAIAHDPDQPSWAYANLAEALFAAGEESAAVAMLDEAIRRDPWPLSLDLRFGRFLVENRMDGHVAQALARAEPLVADHPSVLEEKGRLEVICGRAAEAEAHFLAGLAMAPRHLALNLSLARLLDGQQRYAEAIRPLAHVLEQTPGIDWVIVWLARLHLLSGAAAAAVDLLDRTPWVLERIPEAKEIRLRATATRSSR